MLRARLRLVLNLHEDLLKKPDSKTVHDLRVASRRLREALEFLEPSLPPGWYKKLRAPAKSITKTLGTTRETEVNLKILQKLEQDKVGDPAALEFLVYSQKKQLGKLHRQLLKRIPRDNCDQLVRFLLKLSGSWSRQPASSDLLQKRIQEFTCFIIEADTADEKLHELRIRTKKLRYTTEIYDRIFDKGWKPLIRRFKRFQDLLGEIHDLWVLNELILRKKEKAEDRKLRHIPATLQTIWQQLYAKKEKRKQQVAAIYEQLRTDVEKLPAVAPSPGVQPEKKPFHVEWIQQKPEEGEAKS